MMKINQALQYLFADSSKLWFWNCFNFSQKICQRATIHIL
uniref:Uncharacterized protein MANES_03G037000 n=1 Tax=Rhizophora mucronata TaxID=61149 RepID=A0A2P2MS07_RHIMU